MRKVFVFGSNLAGVHGAGAAHFALVKHGARMGIGEGEHGNSYALPTKDENIETLSLARIKEHIDIFIGHARNNPDITYEITQIGSGLAGYSFRNEIRPLFPEVLPDNCYFINDKGKKLNDG